MTGRWDPTPDQYDGPQPTPPTSIVVSGEQYDQLLTLRPRTDLDGHYINIGHSFERPIDWSVPDGWSCTVDDCICHGNPWAFIDNPDIPWVPEMAATAGDEPEPKRESWLDRLAAALRWTW